MSACLSPPSVSQSWWAIAVTPFVVKLDCTCDWLSVCQNSLMNWCWLRVEPLTQSELLGEVQCSAPLGKGMRQEVSWPVQATRWVPGAASAGSAAAGGAACSEASSVPAQFCRSLASRVFGLE